MKIFNQISNQIWSIISSIIASALFLIITRIFKIPFFNKSVPLWILIIILILFIGNIITSIYNYKKKPKLVFYVSSQFPDNQFQASLIQNIIHQFEYHKIHLVVMFPSKNLDAISQQRLFDNILEYKKYFIGGLIVPADLENHKIELKKFIDDFKKPILFIDAPPPFKDVEFPNNSAFIGYNSFEGGKLAAKAMSYELNKFDMPNFNVLIIASKVVSQRQFGFEEHLKEIMKSKLGELECFDDGQFRREDGSKIYKKVLSLKDSDYLFYQGIFCTNDEMALGVLSTINDIPEFPKEKIIIIGYDSITEATELIKCKDSPIKNSVNQEPDKLASRSVEKLLKMIKDENVVKCEYINPVLYHKI